VLIAWGLYIIIGIASQAPPEIAARLKWAVVAVGVGFVMFWQAE
jgi:hypothetical protein